MPAPYKGNLAMLEFRIMVSVDFIGFD